MIRDTAADSYDQLARDYHWLVPDEMLSGQYVLDQLGDVIRQLRSDAKVLDCSCGIGIDIITLAQSGLAVWGCDASEPMVAEARRRVGEAGLNAHLSVCRWEELPDHFSEQFDLVMCTGSAIPHAPGKQAMVAALAGMRGVLKTDGMLVVDSRNWERLRELQPRVVLPLQPIERDDIRCVPVYICSYPATWDETHTVEIILAFETNRRLTHRRYVLDYHPFRASDLVEAFGLAGFAEIDCDFSSDSVFYSVRARNPSATQSH